ncbi:MAG: divergent PAP2 family protein [Eubacteriales bacterium]
MLESTGFMTGNVAFDCGFVGWFVAQVLKVIVNLVVNRRWEMGLLLSSGGMPSSHSSLIVATVTSIALTEGMDSPIFALGLVMSMIVMYDACNVRRAAGEQAKLLNSIVKLYSEKNWGDFTPQNMTKELKELLGHTPFQVVCGALLGVGVGCLVTVMGV